MFDGEQIGAGGVQVVVYLLAKDSNVSHRHHHRHSLETLNFDARASILLLIEHC